MNAGRAPAFRLLTKYLTKLSFSTGALCFYSGMLKQPEVPQQEMELVTIESLVPADHLLRKTDASVDLEFIRERVRHLYCADNGRPALDPVLLFKLLLIGYCSASAASGS